MPSEEITLSWDEGAQECAEGCVKKKLKGLEWMTVESLQHVAFIRTSRDAPRYGKKVVVAECEDFSYARGDDTLKFLLQHFAKREIKYVFWTYDIFGRLTDEEQLIIAHHELLHIPKNFERIGVEHHDVEEFYAVMKTHKLTRDEILFRLGAKLDEEKKAEEKAEE